MDNNKRYSVILYNNHKRICIVPITELIEIPKKKCFNIGLFKNKKRYSL